MRKEAMIIMVLYSPVCTRKRKKMIRSQMAIHAEWSERPLGQGKEIESTKRLSSIVFTHL
jgi:hypothetical protein